MADGFVSETKNGSEKDALRWPIAIGVLLIVLGLFALFAPFFAGVVLVSVMAWVLLVVGVIHLWLAWHTRGTRSAVWEGLIGLAYIVAGILLLRHPLVGLVSLTLILAVYLLFKGAIELVRAFRLRPAPGSGWMILDGVISVFLALLIGWRLPSASTWVIGTLLGIAILFSGIARLAVALMTQRAYATAV